ncbi:MAG: MarR family transcriptional regulator [Pseudomonadota bacterium]
MSDTRLYLRDEELDRGVGLILAGERRLADVCETVRKDTGLSRSELQALLAIHYQPGLTVSDLRARLATTVPTCARLLAALDARGLVDREVGGEDRRQRQLRLSAEGLALCDPVAAALRKALSLAYRDAGPERVVGARALLEALIR